MSRIATLIAAAVLVASCTTEAAAPPETSTTTTTTVAEVTTSTAATSALADRVEPLGSAIFDPAEVDQEEAAPVSLTIEAIGVADAPVVDVGVLDNGEMEIPGASEVGWYRFGSRPGEEGSAVLAAHIAYNGRDGVFRRLSRLEPGTVFEVAFEDDVVRRFEVVEIARYRKDELPFDRVFAREGEPEVALITCGGDFNRSLSSYEDNIVAYGVPIDQAG